MALFLFRGPPIYAGGTGENAAILANVPAPSASITANVVTPIVWSFIPGQVFIQNETASHNLGIYATISGGYPLRLTLAPSSAGLPSGVTWDEATKSLVGTNPPTVTLVTGVKLRATSGVLVSAIETVAAPSAVMTATATQPVTGNVQAVINGQIPRPSAVVTAIAQQNPPPVGVGYPTTYFVPNYYEYAFCDLPDASAAAGARLPPNHHHTFQIPYDKYVAYFGYASPGPGWYMGDWEATAYWKHIGGDWADANNVFMGATAYASQTVLNVNQYYTWNVYTLVAQWLNGTYRNAGFFMRGLNSNTKYWSSRWQANVAFRPVLRLTSTSLGTVDLQCMRNLWLNNSSENPFPGGSDFRTGGTANSGLLWFDLSGYSAGDITAASLICYGGSGDAGNSTVGIYRVVNPENQEGDHNIPIDDQHIGVAGNYPLDVGIENDPSVLFVQKFPAGSTNGVRNFDLLWMPGDSQRWMSGGDDVLTPADVAAEGNGWTPLAGIYNSYPRYDGAARSSNFCQAWWSPWRGYPPEGSPHRLKPYTVIEEGFMRYYLMFGLDWDPYPDGGKMPGFDGRYTQIGGNNPSYQPSAPTRLGMGRGNSGSGTDGYTGWSARLNYSRRKTPGDSMSELRGIGSNDSYIIDMTNTFGGDLGWGQHYLGQLRKGEWHCIELQVKLNSVTFPEEHPRHILSWTQTGGVATVILEQAEDLNDPNYQVGQVWSFGGSGNYAYAAYNGEHPILSIINDHTFTHSVSTSAPATAIPGSGPSLPVWLCCSPSIGNYDGIIRGWVNGRMAREYTHVRMRHVRYRPDGGILGIDNMWFLNFMGGAGGNQQGVFTCYFSNFVVATSYVGPLVGYP